MMRSMALGSARTRYLVLVLKLAKTAAKLCTACGTEFVTLIGSKPNCVASAHTPY